MRTIQIRVENALIHKAQALVGKGFYSNKSEVFRDSLRRLVLKDELILANERKFIILFSSDMHGNMIQFRKLFATAYAEMADAVIIGGDITPKDEKHRTISQQGLFLKKRLASLIDEFNTSNNKRNHFCKIFLLMGNDDFKANYGLLQKIGLKVGFYVIHNRCLKIHEDFNIIGYSFVPLTPFINKDWEKLDLNKETECSYRKSFVLEGRKSKGIHFRKISFDINNRKDTIENDLTRLLKGKNMRKTIFVAHAPPYGTSLDLLAGNEHAGSIAIKNMIEDKQPYLTLHGHIHETVANSGRFMQTISKTIVIGSGNSNFGENIAVIKLNLYNPGSAERLII